jgi:hypothetical protein
MATLQTTGETNETTQLTELEYSQAVVEKQRRLISIKDRDIRELSSRVQGAYAALEEGLGAMRKYEDKLKTIQLQREAFESKLQTAQSEKQELASKLDVANALLKRAWQLCASYPISQHLLSTKVFAQIADIVSYNDEQSPAQHQATIEAGLPSTPDTAGEQPHSVSDKHAVPFNHLHDDGSNPSSCKEKGSRSEHIPLSTPTTRTIPRLHHTGDGTAISGSYGVSMLPAKRSHPDSDNEIAAKLWVGDERVAAPTDAAIVTDVERPASKTTSTPVPTGPSTEHGRL